MLKCYKFLFKRNKELGFTFWWPEAARTLEVVSCLFCQHSLFFHGDHDDDWPESFWLKRVEMVGVSWILDLFQCDPTFLFGSIACLVRPLSYIFYLFRDTLLAHIWHAQPNTSHYSIWLFDWAYHIWSSGVSQKKSFEMWLRRFDITSLRRCSSCRNSLRVFNRPIHRDGITALTLKCLKCHYGKSAQYFFQS